MPVFFYYAYNHLSSFVNLLAFSLGIVSSIDLFLVVHFLIFSPLPRGTLNIQNFLNLFGYNYALKVVSAKTVAATLSKDTEEPRLFWAGTGWLPVTK